MRTYRASSPTGDRLLVTATLTVDPASLSGPATQAANGGPKIAWRLPYERMPPARRTFAARRVDAGKVAMEFRLPNPERSNA